MVLISLLILYSVLPHALPHSVQTSPLRSPWHPSPMYCHLHHSSSNISPLLTSLDVPIPSQSPISQLVPLLHNRRSTSDDSVPYHHLLCHTLRPHHHLQFCYFHFLNCFPVTATVYIQNTILYVIQTSILGIYKRTKHKQQWYKIIEIMILFMEQTLESEVGQKKNPCPRETGRAN